MKKVGILYICTGKYDIFWKDFYLSSEKYFLNEEGENKIKNLEKHYFVWTDAEVIFGEKENKNIHRIYQENLGWPGNTLMRFDMFLKRRTDLKEMDFIFFFNANCLVIKNISSQEFLPDINREEKLLATLHPGFFNKDREKFTYDENEESLAFIEKDKGKYYFAGGLNGGIGEEFFKACQNMNEKIKKDLSKEIIARFHDESHWNKYLIDREDIKILGPEYLYPEDWHLKLNKEIKIIIRDKEKYIPVFQDRLKNIPFIKRYFYIYRLKISKVLKRYGLIKY